MYLVVIYYIFYALTFEWLFVFYFAIFGLLFVILFYEW